MNPLRLIPAIASGALLLAACASIGRPGGGPRDETPPEFVRSSPMPGSLNVDKKTISIYFDENVSLDDAFNKVVVSPVQQEVARVSSNGRRVTVQLFDTLIPNTTYTIDFADAIKDLNEGNILDGFALDFSTGDVLDSLRISGTVLAAENLEPAQGIVVGAYSNLEDSAIRTLRPSRIARTNQLGQFTIRNLAPGTYRIYAFKDINRDWHWDRTEDVAFLDSLVVPDVAEISVNDTLYAADRSDSIIQRRGVQFLPNDLLLTWFNEGYSSHYLKDYNRPERRLININLSTPPDSAFEVRIADGPPDTTLFGKLAQEWGIPIISSNGDSLALWIADTTVLKTDSLRLSVRYLRTDSGDVKSWRTDTLRFFFRDPKRSKKEIEADTLPPRFDNLALRLSSGTSMDVNVPLRFAVNQPIRSLDTAGVHFSVQVDTLWKPLPFVLQPDSLKPYFGLLIDEKWTPGGKYRLEVDSAAIVSIYNEHNPYFKQDITVKSLEEYANLFLTLVGADSTAVVELLTKSDEPVMRSPVVNGRAEFRFVKPGTYYARMFFDTDGNGLWSTGMLDSIQPEEVAYYPSKLELKKNWDIEQTWDIYELPVDKQKPYALLKNKPKLKKGETAPRDEQEEDDPFADPWMNTGNRNTLNNRTNGNRNGMNNSLGGFQQMGNMLR